MPYKDPEQKREFDRRRARERRARGLCNSCTQPAESGRSRCEDCRQKYNARRRRSRLQPPV